MEKRQERNLAAHQRVMYEMLCEIDRICREENIAYQLFAGTALGAVREKGFIPWDDDLDIVLLRPEYERFLEKARLKLDPEKYFVQREYTKHWPMHFSKIRRNHTACIERFIPRDPELHQGIYIDIFPCDNLSDHRIVRGMQYAASKVVIAKSLEKRGYLTDSRIKKMFLKVCCILPRTPFWKFSVLKGKKETKLVHTFFGASSRYKKSIFPRCWFTESTEMSFEGGSYPVSAHYDELLTRLYGDYSVPTPENEREKKVHAELVDTEHSYTEYSGIQRQMQFREYTKSIR